MRTRIAVTNVGQMSSRIGQTDCRMMGAAQRRLVRREPFSGTNLTAMIPKPGNWLCAGSAAT